MSNLVHSNVYYVQAQKQSNNICLHIYARVQISAWAVLDCLRAPSLYFKEKACILLVSSNLGRKKKIASIKPPCKDKNMHHE